MDMAALYGAASSQVQASVRGPPQYIATPGDKHGGMEWRHQGGIGVAQRGGRRQQTWGAPMSWREAEVLEAARAVAAARGGAQSRADWLLGLAQIVLREGLQDLSLPASVRERGSRALEGLAKEGAELAAHPPRVGRPPQV